MKKTQTPAPDKSSIEAMTQIGRAIPLSNEIYGDVTPVLVNEYMDDDFTVYRVDVRLPRFRIAPDGGEFGAWIAF